MLGAHPPSARVRGVRKGRIKTVQVEVRRAVVAADDRAHVICTPPTNVAEDWLLSVGVDHPQEGLIVVGRSGSFGPRRLSQTGYVGNRLVETPIPNALGLGRVHLQTFGDADEVSLDVGRRDVLGLALLVATMCDGGGEGVADSTAWAVPLALGRVVGIRGRT